MKSLRSRILTPFLILFIVIPLIALLLFNFVMVLYINNTTRSDLVNTSAGIETLIKQEILVQYQNGTLADATLREKLVLLRGSLKVSRLISNTEFVIVSKNGTVLFPQTFTNSYLNDAIVAKAYAQLKSVPKNEAVQFRLSGTRYFTLKKTIGTGLKSFEVIFVATTENSNGIVFFINLILIGIFLIGNIINGFVAIRVSNKIAKPIADLNEYAKQIGKGDFVAIPQNNSSRELAELSQAMNTMSGNLKDKEQATTLFLQNSSHELRTPLMSVQGYAEGIMTGVFADNVEAAKVIHTESKRITALVDELLTLSKIENKTHKQELIDFNLPDLVKQFTSKLQGYALQEKKEIDLQIDQEFIPVRVDEKLLMQGFDNILSNAINYAKEKVIVKVSVQNRQALIRISDDGEGISLTDLPHIFERFYKGKSGNFGLGLAIAKSAIEYMGGKITAGNANGAVFEITLPVN
jgi:two-component system, OmpR family, sensor histidine kinase CssS